MGIVRLALGERIRTARLARGWTQATLADQLGVAENSVVRWEKGINLAQTRLARLATVLSQTSEEQTKLLEALLALYASSKHRITTPSRSAADRAYEFYSNNRPMLSDLILKSRYYTDADLIDDFPILSRAAWIPSRALPLAQVKLHWRAVSPPLRVPRFAHHRSFADYKNHRRERVENNYCYRLLEVVCDGRAPSFTFGPSRYSDYINTGERLGYELAQWCLRKENKQEGDLAIRLRMQRQELPMRYAQMPFDEMSKFCAGSGTTTLALHLYYPPANGRHVVFIQDRLGKEVAEGRNSLHLVPTGTFQPDGTENLHHPRDFSLTRTVMREFAEEFLGKEEFQEMTRHSYDFTQDERLQPFLQAMKQGHIRLWWLGFGLDALTKKAEFLTAMVIDWRHLGSVSGMNTAGNWEGTNIEVDVATSLNHLAENEPRLFPASVACCRLGLRQLDALLKPHRVSLK